MIKYMYPLKYVAITQEFKSGSHYGLDLGWTSKIADCGKNQDVFASADGVVYAIHDNDTTGKSWGNYVKIKHDDGSFTLYGHLKHGIKVKKNQKVVRGQVIGNMGATGNARGNHVHFEIYIGGAGTKFRVNPLPITYVYSGQIVCDSDKNKVNYYNPVPTETNIEKAIKKLDEARMLINDAELLLKEVE